MYFVGDGTLTYKTPSGIWTVATWRQENNNIYFEMNNKFVEHRGTIHGNEMSGEGWTIKGHRGTWSVKKQPSNLSELAQAKSSTKLQPASTATLLSLAEYTGLYEGSITFDASSLTIRIRCNSSNSCDIETISVQGEAKPVSRIDRLTNFSPVSNWAGVQRAVQYARENSANRISNKEHAAILEKLKPLLDSDTVVDRCVDLNYGGRGASLLCRSSSSPWRESVLLFFGASLNTCGQGFCGYVIYPLFKKLSADSIH